MPGIVLGAGEAVVNKIEKVPVPDEFTNIPPIHQMMIRTWT